MIGGGVGGCSIAYHLAKLGLRGRRARRAVRPDVRLDLALGRPRRPAALVRVADADDDVLGRALRRAAARDGQGPRAGTSSAASASPRRPSALEEIQRQAGWAKTFGLPLEIISAAEAQERFPLMSPDGVLGAAFLPRDGYLDPSQLTFALADGARHYGAEINTRTRVTAIERDARGRVCRVVTDKGEIETEVVVDAAGMAAPDVARLVGVTVPIIPMAHQYLITEPFDPPLAPLPTLRDPDNLVYWRTEVGGLVMGGYERDPAPFGARRHSRGLRGAAPDLGLRALRGADGGLHPARAGDGGGPGQEVLQRPRGVHARRRVHPRPVGGAGLLGRRGVLRARPRRRRRDRQGHGGVDRRRPARVGPLAHGHPPLRPPVPLPGATRSRARPRCTRPTTTSSTRARSAWPGGRCASRRPIARHTANGASFGEKSGWERVNWFDPNHGDGDESLRPRGWAGQNWSPAIEAECLAAGERAVLIDQSSFAKIDVHGPGACAFLDRMCANAVDRPLGSVIYTQLLNARGGIEADVTLVRLASDRYLYVTGTAFGSHNLAWLRQHLPGRGPRRRHHLVARRATASGARARATSCSR